MWLQSTIHRNFITCLRTPWRRVLFEKLTGFQRVKKFSAYYGTEKFITAITSARHLSLFWARSILSLPPTSHFLKIYLTIILPFTPGLFPSGFPIAILYMPLLTPIRATCPTHLIPLDFITRTILGEEYRLLSSSLCSFLHSPVTSSFSGPNILLNTLLSNTLSLRSSLKCERPSFTPIQNNKQNYSSVYRNLLIFW